MQVYAFHPSGGALVFYAPPQPIKPVPIETAPSDFKGLMLVRMRRTYAEAWTLMQESPKRIWVWMRAILRQLEKLIHPYEPLLRLLNEASAVEILHPENADPKEVKAQWEALLHRRLAIHRRGIIFNCCLLPITAAAVLLPGPNIFIAWNALRLYGHITARRGALRALNELPFSCLPDSRLPNDLSPVGRIAPCEIEALAQTLKLEGLANHFQNLKLCAP